MEASEKKTNSLHKSIERIVLGVFIVIGAGMLSNLLLAIILGDFAKKEPDWHVSFEELGVNPELPPYRIDILSDRIVTDDQKTISLEGLRTTVNTLAARGQMISLCYNPNGPSIQIPYEGKSTNRLIEYTLFPQIDTDPFIKPAHSIVMGSGLPIEIRSEPIGNIHEGITNQRSQSDTLQSRESDG